MKFFQKKLGNIFTLDSDGAVSPGNGDEWTEPLTGMEGSEGFRIMHNWEGEPPVTGSQAEPGNQQPRDEGFRLVTAEQIFVTGSGCGYTASATDIWRLSVRQKVATVSGSPSKKSSKNPLRLSCGG